MHARQPTPVVESDAAELLRLRAAHEAMLHQHAEEVSQLREGLLSRKVIGQALGLLMREYNLHEDAAFAVLLRRSTYANIELCALASEMVDQANSAGTPLRSVADAEGIPSLRVPSCSISERLERAVRCEGHHATPTRWATHGGPQKRSTS